MWAATLVWTWGLDRLGNISVVSLLSLSERGTPSFNPVLYAYKFICLGAQLVVRGHGVVSFPGSGRILAVRVLQFVVGKRKENKNVRY